MWHRIPFFDGDDWATLTLRISQYNIYMYSIKAEKTLSLMEKDVSYKRLRSKTLAESPLQFYLRHFFQLVFAASKQKNFPKKMNALYIHRLKNESINTHGGLSGSRSCSRIFAWVKIEKMFS